MCSGDRGLILCWRQAYRCQQSRCGSRSRFHGSWLYEPIFSYAAVSKGATIDLFVNQLKSLLFLFASSGILQQQPRSIHRHCQTINSAALLQFRPEYAVPKPYLHRVISLSATSHLIFKQLMETCCLKRLSNNIDYS